MLKGVKRTPQSWKGTSSHEDTTCNISTPYRSIGDLQLLRCARLGLCFLCCARQCECRCGVDQRQLRCERLPDLRLLVRSSGVRLHRCRNRNFHHCRAHGTVLCTPLVAGVVVPWPVPLPARHSSRTRPTGIPTRPSSQHATTGRHYAAAAPERLSPQAPGCKRFPQACLAGHARSRSCFFHHACAGESESSSGSKSDCAGCGQFPQACRAAHRSPRYLDYACTGWNGCSPPHCTRYRQARHLYHAGTGRDRHPETGYPSRELSKDLYHAGDWRIQHS